MTEETSRRSDRIFLTGFMGSGKSTIGPILANTIGYEFLDVDKTIESRENKTVNELFREHGEAHFRSLERSLITGIVGRRGLVISLGGGTVTDPDTFRIITTSGILVYLKMTPEQLYRRLHHRSDRPLLSDDQGNRLTEEALRERIQTLFAAREPLYARADIVVVTDELRVGLTVDSIVKRLNHFLR